MSDLLRQRCVRLWSEEIEDELRQALSAGKKRKLQSFTCASWDRR